MRAEFLTEGDDVVYLLRDVDPKYEDVLRLCFWDQDELGWYRSYPREAPYLYLATQRFAANCEEMFAQLAYYRPVRWEKALLDFADRAEAQGVFWWLSGSVSACIRGVPLNPHDVDVMIDAEDVPEVARIFQDFIVEPFVDTQGWLTKDFGVLFWHARIDLASDPSPTLDDPEPADCGPYARENLEVVEYKGRLIRVPPLELVAATNRRRRRNERAEMIEAVLAEKR